MDQRDEKPIFVGTANLDRLDERMHTTQWFHATRIPNIPSANLVQIGIGGWAGMAVARERGTTVLTIGDVELLGIERAAEAALEIASQNTKAIFLSLDIDVVDPGNAPGSGTPSREGCRRRGEARPPSPVGPQLTPAHVRPDLRVVCGQERGG